MRVVFLDFDGVLNSTATHRRQARGLCPGWPPGGIRGLDPQNVPPLNEILDKSGAAIVISSSWRLLHPLDELRAFLSALGVRGTVLGQTPRGAFDAERGLYGSSVRGLEIQAWLDESPFVTDFVILDDASDMAHLRGKLVQTSDQSGLLPKHARKALEILGCES